MPTEDKDAARLNPEEAPEEDNFTATEDIHIPDYVMLDFGFLEGRGASGQSPA